MAAPNVPIPQNPIGENFVWRDWFQKLGNRVFGSMSGQDSNAVFITGGSIDGAIIGNVTPAPITSTTLEVTLLTGYMKANNTSGIVTAATTIPNTDVAGLGTWSTLNTSAPTIKTADFTVASAETWLINNKVAALCTVTLPTVGSAAIGRILYFVNYQAFTVVSNAANVVQLTGGAPTTAILPAVAGSAATLVCDGTNWIRMQ